MAQQDQFGSLGQEIVAAIVRQGAVAAYADDIGSGMNTITGADPRGLLANQYLWNEHCGAGELHDHCDVRAYRNRVPDSNTEHRRQRRW
jgi:hypothetical protein